MALRDKLHEKLHSVIAPSSLSKGIGIQSLGKVEKKVEEKAEKKYGEKSEINSRVKSGYKNKN